MKLAEESDWRKSQTGFARRSLMNFGLLAWSTSHTSGFVARANKLPCGKKLGISARLTATGQSSRNIRRCQSKSSKPAPRGLNSLLRPVSLAGRGGGRALAGFNRGAHRLGTRLAAWINEEYFEE